jgi:beta-glucosidase
VIKLLQNCLTDRKQDDMPDVVIPDGFELGVATSAYQIEGAWNLDGKGPSIWDTFTNAPGHTRGDVPGNDGVDHYRRLDEDVAHLRALGVNAYRFSLSWPRILPSGTGAVNAAGVDFYDRLIDRLVESGITPNATLYHWDLPQALQDRGGWVNPQMPRWFSEYAALCFERFGDRVHRWATINEPIALWVGYGLGIFAPGTTDPRAGKQAMHHAMVAHGQAVQAFRASGKPGTIGIVLDVWKRHPATDSDADKALAQHDENDGFRFFFDELFAGGWNSSLQEQMRVENVTPRHTDEDFQCAAEPIDWLGLNIYSRVLVSAENYNPRWWEASEEQIFPGGNFLANGQEFYPPALRDAVEIARNEYAVNVPIYITENGCPDSASKPGTPVLRDGERIRYLSAFLDEAVRAAGDGLGVAGYYAWSMLDTYEWASAYTERFGLIHVDPSTMEREWKDSAYWFRDVCRNRCFAIPAEAHDRGHSGAIA